MSRLMTTGIAVWTTLTVLTPRTALGWSRDGHRIVCRIAWQLLDQARRAEIERVTSAYRNPDGQPVGPWWDACAYADDARRKATSMPSWRRFAIFETWHFANVPRTTTRLANPPCQAPCIITAVHAHADSLDHAGSDQSKAEALSFLGHWVGDLHQPLHVSFADDRGGNEVRPIEGGFYTSANMHAVWDTGMLSRLLRGAAWQDFADKLARDVTPAQRATWAEGAAVDWAQESYNIITSTNAQYCDWQGMGGATTCAARAGGRTLGEAYQLEFADDVTVRLQQAGVRLADLLRQHLTVR